MAHRHATDGTPAPASRSVAELRYPPGGQRTCAAATLAADAGCLR